MAVASPDGTTLFVCVTCRTQTNSATDAEQPRAGARLLAAIRAASREEADGLSIVPVECLSNCNRSCTVAVTAPGKWTYVIGSLDPDSHADDALAFARLHRSHANGLPAWRERPEHIRKNTIARVPPLPAHSSVEVSLP
jgi:predicted metal-binding protein